jgi:hypothetical protein
MIFVGVQRDVGRLLAATSIKNHHTNFLAGFGEQLADFLEKQ